MPINNPPHLKKFGLHISLKVKKILRYILYDPLHLWVTYILFYNINYYFIKWNLNLYLLEELEAVNVIDRYIMYIDFCFKKPVQEKFENILNTTSLKVIKTIIILVIWAFFS